MPWSKLSKSHQDDPINHGHFEDENPLVALNTEPVKSEIGPSDEHRNRVRHDVVVFDLTEVRAEHYPEKGRHEQIRGQNN